MKETYTAREIAEIMGWARTTIVRRLQKGNCRFQESAGRGGKQKEYLFDSLPEDIRMAIMTQTLAEKEAQPGIVSREPCALEAWQRKKALAWADLVRLYVEYVTRKANGHGSKMIAKKNFVLAYNAKAYPTLYGILGKTSFQTLERQIGKLKKEPDPITALAPRHGGNRGKRSVGPEQAGVLLSIVRSPYQPKRKTEIIRIARAVMDQKEIHDSLSDATYRRFLDDWISVHYDQWIFWREGEKGLHNKCLYWIERDYDRIEVGDILVADGHILNFEILNPWTGKPKRMMLLLWFDMKSNFPCGWEIMPTEDTEGINSALRRAILMLGKIPKIAYLDNGKAFSSRFFKGEKSLEETGFGGVFKRLGIRSIYAWPYHPQSKVVERFFGSFAELERIAPSYVGTSIAEKPPRLNRGEKLHRRIHEKITQGKVPTLMQAHQAIAAWFDDYARRPQQSGHLKGIRPIDVFAPGQGPGVDSIKLRELMMGMEIRTIQRRGIKFLGTWYYHPRLYGRKHAVTIKYDLQDDGYIFIYKGKEFLCEALKAGKTHPAAKILGTDEDQARLADEIHLKKSLEKSTVSTARALLKSEVIPEVTRQITAAGFAPDVPGLPPKEKKMKALALSDEERARIESDFEALEREQERIDPINWANLAEVPDMDRYEKLLEYEVQGVLIPKDEQGFMRYFEQTEQYTKYTDYFDEHRTKMVMMYQK